MKLGIGKEVKEEEMLGYIEVGKFKASLDNRSASVLYSLRICVIVYLGNYDRREDASIKRGYSPKDLTS